MENLTKTQAEEEIKEFFQNIENKKPEEIKKIKKLAMHYSIKLKDKRKLFCKKCYSVFPQNAEIRIKQRKKIVKCKRCGYVGRWRVN